MWRDPIVEETRKRRDEYAAEFSFDADAIFDDIQKRQREAGKRLVSFPARKSLHKTTPLNIYESSVVNCKSRPSDNIQ